MSKPRLAVLVGSSRRQSINRTLAEALVRLAGDRLAASVVAIDDLPMYNQDDESPLPAPVARFKAEIAAADAVLIVTPEHNRSLPAMLKNAIDWGTRPYGQNVWAGKVAAITGTSPGSAGTALAQQHLRQILGNLGVLVMGGEAYVTDQPGLIDDAGTVTDAGTRQFLQSLADRLAGLAARHAAASADVRAA